MQTAKPSFTLIFASSSFFFFLLLCRLPAGVSADNSPKTKMNENEKENAAQLLMGKYVVPTHSSFLKSEIGRRRRRGYVWCGRNSSICEEREGKGSRCCWKSFCKNISDDNNHCGECGNACGSGLSCCNGRCVDLNNNRHHCGGCHRHCPSHQRCYFGMCDYSGG